MIRMWLSPFCLDRGVLGITPEDIGGCNVLDVWVVTGVVELTLFMGHAVRC